jgi:benzoyl-CoA reductase subunit B
VEARELPLEERLFNLLSLASSIPEDVTEGELEDLISAVPSQAGALRNLFLSDPSVRKAALEAVRWSSWYLGMLRGASEEGRKVVLSSFNTAPEVLYALDLVPLVPELLTSFATLFLEDPHVYFDWSVEEGLLETMCTSQRVACGAILKGLGLRPDLVVTTAPGSCDANSKLYEYMAVRLGIPYLGIDCPTYHGERAFEYYVKEYRHQVRRLEELSGRKLEEERLREVVEESERCRRIYLEINDLKRARPNPVHASFNGFLQAVKFSSVGRPEGTRVFEAVLEASRERLRKGVGPRPEERIRQIWVYTGFYSPNLELWFWLEENGMSYVVDILALFQAERPIDTSSTESMLRGLAQRCWSYPMTRQQRGPMDFPEQWLEDYLWCVEQWGGDCFVFAGHPACKNTWGGFQAFIRALQRETGLPCLRLEADCWDFRVAPVSEIERRILEFNQTMGLG